MEENYKKRFTAIEKAVNQIKKSPLHDDLLYEIVCNALEYFEECTEDFCIQNFHGDSITFGGTNRLLWHPKSGYRPDPSYCTPKFLKYAQKIRPKL